MKFIGRCHGYEEIYRKIQDRSGQEITERGHAVTELAGRLEVPTHSLYQWTNRYRVPQAEREASKNQQAELRRLKAKLKRVMEERDIQKKAAAYFSKVSG